MKKSFFILTTSLLTLCMSAQNGIGYVKNKNTDLYYNNGSRAFFCGVNASGYTLSCVDLDSAKITETEFPGKSNARISSSYVLIGINNFYKITQIAKKDDLGMFPDVVITSWDGKSEPKRYEFPGRWNGELRYAIANDRDLYFMLDVTPAAFSEESVYRTKHSLLHLNLVSGTLSEIPCPLSMKYSAPQCSFWCPLRIGDNYTEWYRTKMVNKKFTYEITRLDVNGHEVWTRTADIPGLTYSPDFEPELPGYHDNILSSSQVWSQRDTVRNTIAFSLLAIAPLHYQAETNQYYSVVRISEFNKNYTRGICLFVLDSNLAGARATEAVSIIQGDANRFPHPDEFSSASVYVAFTNDTTACVDIVYRKLNGKMIERHAYQVGERSLSEQGFGYSFSGMTGSYYPGAYEEGERRQQVTTVVVEDLNRAMFVCTKKGTLYYVPDQKETNVFFVKAKS